jgi:hypothetical protein
MKERWLEVPGFPAYDVSDRGRVRSRYLGGRMMKTGCHAAGYPAVNLWRDRKPTLRTVHSLVADAFLGPRPDGYYVCHRDGGRTNNRLPNLKYATPTENMADAKRHGVTRRVLTPQQVRDVRAALKTGEAQRVIGARYGVTQATISNVKRGRYPSR